MPRCPACQQPADDLQKHRLRCPKRDAHLARLRAGFSEPGPAPTPDIHPMDVGGASPEPETDDIDTDEPMHEVDSRTLISAPDAIPIAESSSGRQRHFPRALASFGFIPNSQYARRGLDMPPSPQITTPEVELELGATDPAPSRTESPESVPDTGYTTAPDRFNIYRVYPTGAPTHDPYNITSSGPRALRSSAPAARPHITSQSSQELTPFPNTSRFLLSKWANTGSELKSDREVNGLVNDVLSHPEFSVNDLRPGGRKYNQARENALVDDYLAGKVRSKSKSHLTPPLNTILRPEDGWRESSVTIPLSFTGKSYPNEAAAPTLTINGVMTRSLTEIVKSNFETRSDLHFTPHHEFWQHPLQPESSPQRIERQIFTSQDTVQQYTALLKEKSWRPGQFELVLALCMIYTDMTLLTHFGGATLWGGYLFFGNQDKYPRGEPSSHSANHFAYFPQMPDWVQERYERLYGKAARDYIIRFLKRELVHKVWEQLLLDEDFLEAYENGMEVQCWDSIIRLIFPRISTYIADYPEKMLMASLKALGRCPCPLCYIQKKDIDQLGKQFSRRRSLQLRIDTPRRQQLIELVRRWIFEEGYSVESAAIDRVLGTTSQLPTRNAFSTRLLRLGLNFYLLFKPDIMHELEAGIFKAIFRHLLRILYALGDGKITELNRRFRKIPAFGRGTIRRFKKNVSGMKMLACRDWEDLAQCSIVAFEGLFDNDAEEKVILDLLFVFGRLHGYCKTRLHWEDSLERQDRNTSSFGTLIRRFATQVCAHHSTHELPQNETGYRGASRRRQGAGKVVIFNPNTPKMHLPEHYVHITRVFSTLDNFSAQAGEQEHRVVKQLARRTNKTDIEKGIARREQRGRYLRDLFKRLRSKLLPDHEAERTSNRPQMQAADPSRTNYRVAQEADYQCILSLWREVHQDDLAVVGFTRRLTFFLCAHLSGVPLHEFTLHDEHFRSLHILNEQLHFHNTLRIDYWAYDTHTQSDTLSTANRPYFAARNPDQSPGASPYVYGQILAIMHVMALLHSAGASATSSHTRVDLCYVRWFEPAPRSPGWNKLRYPRLQFIPYNHRTKHAFGFVHAKDIVREAHIMPAFAFGLTDELLPCHPTLGRPNLSIHQPQPDDDEIGQDYVYYYLGGISDRDWLARMEGGGPGHFARKGGFHVGDMSAYHIDPDEGEGDNEWEDDGELVTIDISKADLVRAQQMDGAHDDVDEDEEAGDEDEADDYGYGDRGWNSSDEENGGGEGEDEGEQGDIEALGFDNL